MTTNHKLALYVAYYLSRFDKVAYSRLNIGTQKQTHEKVGEILNVNPHTLKNMRDEFDPLYGHRKGWYQRPMSPSRAKVVEALQDVDEHLLHDIISDILVNKEFRESDEVAELTQIISSDNPQKKGKFVVRSVTGRKAEEFFMSYHVEHGKPLLGRLIDTRDLGCGYDFRIEDGEEAFFVEVKGMSGYTGGVLFTDKEWNIARKEGNNYYLAIVRNVEDSPEIQFIRNPAMKLTANRIIYTSVQVQWHVTGADIE